MFDGIVKSEEFNLLPIDRQLSVIEKLNKYTSEALLQADFRKKFKNIKFFFKK